MIESNIVINVCIYFVCFKNQIKKKRSHPQTHLILTHIQSIMKKQQQQLQQPKTI